MTGCFTSCDPCLRRSLDCSTRRGLFHTRPSMPAKIYSDKDADLKALKNKTVAVIGFGSQGHAHALNLKESGVKVIIGLYPGSKSIDAAKKHDFKVVTSAEAVKEA